MKRAGGGGRTGVRRRWVRRLLVAVVLAPLLLFGLSNLWLASPLGRAWIGGRIERASGLPARVDSGWWLPWRGLCLRGIEVGRPAELAVDGCEPVLRVERLMVEPHWKQLARGRLVPGRIEVDRPVAAVPVELLAYLAGAGPAAAPGVPVEPVDPGEPGEPGEPGDLAEGGTGDAVGDAVGELVAADEPEIAELPATSWLVVRGGCIRVGPAAGGRDWLAVTGVEAEVPLRGRPADGMLKVGELVVADGVAADIEVPLRWESPRLSVRDWQAVAGPLSGVVNVQCMLFASFPFVAEWRLPEQAMAAGSPGVPAGLGAARIAGVGRLGGHLRVPSTIAGEAAIDAREVTGRLAGRPLAFDHCQARARVSGGAIHLLDARAVGDSLALLGNGVVVADGRVGAVLRVVAPEETALGLVEESRGLLPDPPAGFRPLETRDRWGIDFRLGGTTGDCWVRFGDGPAQGLDEAIEGLKRVIRGAGERDG